MLLLGPDNDDDDAESTSHLKPIDQLQLGKFLQNAARTIICLIEEDRLASGGGDRKPRQQRSDICLSEAFAELEFGALGGLLKGRHVTQCHISPAQSHMMLTVFSESERSSKVSHVRDW